MLRRILSTALCLALALSVSAAGYGYAAGADHCWMMATHSHHMHAAAEHCDPAAGMDSQHHAMHHGGAPSSTISSEMPACQCCLGPATSILQPDINRSFATLMAPAGLQVVSHEAPLLASFEQSSSAPRAPPAHLL